MEPYDASAPRPISVVALGELLIDFTQTDRLPNGYPVMQANPGGAPPNFLAALAARGFGSAIYCKVGQDMFGDMLKQTLRDAGISDRGIVTDAQAFTTLAFVKLDPATGDREFSFARKPGADTQLRFEELDLSLIDAAECFHFGTLSLTDEPAADATRRAVAYAKQAGKIISFDPNLRMPLWDSPEHAKKEMIWGLSQADIVKISDNEAEFLWGTDPERSARKLLSEYGCRAVFVTCGADGCVYASADGMGREPALTGIRPIDTTGAGDIFGGSALSILLEADLKCFDLEIMRKAARYGCTAAGLSTEKNGGIPSVPPQEAVWRRMTASKEN